MKIKRDCLRYSDNPAGIIRSRQSYHNTTKRLAPCLVMLFVNNLKEY